MQISEIVYDSKQQRDETEIPPDTNNNPYTNNFVLAEDYCVSGKPFYI